MAVTDPNFNPSGNPAITEIKEGANALAKLIEKSATPCRRRSIALTHLETAAMFAVKAVADPD